MYFLLVYQLLTVDMAGWVQLGAYETEAQCQKVANAMHKATPETLLNAICAPSKEPGKKV